MPATFHAVKFRDRLVAAGQEGLDALRGVKDGETVKLVMTRASKRSLAHHRKLFALLKVAGDAVGWNKDQTLCWVKVATGHCDVLFDKREIAIFYPRSISFEAMSQDEFGVFFERAVDAILTRLLPEGTSREAFLDEVMGEVNERYVDAPSRPVRRQGEVTT